MDLLSPPRLGRSFRWLFASVATTNLGDGILMSAGPLLVASETQDPLLVSGAFFFQQLPWLLFGVFAGAWVDRVDRRLLVALVDVLRACVIAVLALTVFTGTVDVTVVLVTMFVLGTAETFSDVGSSTLLVSTVEKADLGVGNARLFGGLLVCNRLVGPPVGAFLFAVGRGWPFATTAVCFLVGAVLVSRVVLRPRAVPEQREPILAEIREGMGWLARNPPVRTLALTIVLFNVTFGAAWGVLVLYADRQLGLSEAGFGWLATCSAVGGLLGTAAYSRLERWIGMAGLMRIGLVLETLTHLGLALTHVAWGAFTIMFVFGAHAAVWGTTSQTVRQRAVPEDLQGRVGSVYLIGAVTGLLLGAPLGGALARTWGITAPFWFGFVGSALLVVAVWRSLGQIAHETDTTAVRMGR